MWRSATDLVAGGRTRPLVSLAALVAAVFGVALGFDFVRWDDPVNVTHNPMLTAPWSWDLVAKLVNGDTALRFKPLPWLLYRATHAAFGFNPAAWHALNLALHLAATWACWLALRATLDRLRPATPETTRAALAWLGAAAWAVHPAHVEAACWVTATPYPLMTALLLLSFRHYLRAIDPTAPDARRSLSWAWVLALAAYSTYPVGVTYAGWLAVAEIWIFRTAPAGRFVFSAWARWALRPLVFLLPAVASVLVTWKSSSTTPWLYPAPATLAEVGVPVRLLMASAMLASVWTHFLWPFGLTPNNPMLPPDMVGGPMILAMAALAIGGVVVALVASRRFPAAAGAVLGGSVLALPVLGFTQWPSWAVADRHVYLPHLVFTGALVVGLAGVAARHERRVLLGGLAVVAALALLGHRQVRIWRDTDSLFTYIAAQPAFAWNPIQQSYIHQLWGADAAERGDPAKARTHQDQARRVLLEGMFAAAERSQWDPAIEISQHLEGSFGLPPVLRRERVRWLLARHRLAEAAADLAQVQRELPADPATAELVQEWQRQANPAAGNHL